MIGNFLRIQALCKTPVISESTQTELEARGFLEVPNGRHTFQQLQEVQSNYANCARAVAEVALNVFLPIATAAGFLAAGLALDLPVLLPLIVIPYMYAACVFREEGYYEGGYYEGWSAKLKREIRSLPSSETVTELMKKMKEHLDATYRYIQDHGESMERLTDGTVREEIRSLRHFFANHPRVRAEIQELLFVSDCQEDVRLGGMKYRAYRNQQGRVMNLYEEKPLPSQTELYSIREQEDLFSFMSPRTEVFVGIGKAPDTPFPSVVRLYRNSGCLRAEPGEPLPPKTPPSAPAIS